MTEWLQRKVFFVTEPRPESLRPGAFRLGRQGDRWRWWPAARTPGRWPSLLSEDGGKALPTGPDITDEEQARWRSRIHIGAAA